MFEKEAEEYIKHILFGFETELVQKIVRMYCKSTFQDGAEFGYNKANEWHYVKDGDLPKEHCKRFLLCLNNKEIMFGCYNGQFFTTLSSDYSKEEVYAWREIPKPPKEIE